MFMREKIEDINRRLKLLEDCYNIVIWGGGYHTSKLFEKTELLSYPIKSVVGTQEQGNFYFGFTINHPKEIVWSEIDAVVVSAPGREEKVVHTLNNDLGFSGKIVTLYKEDHTIPFYKLYNDNLKQICYLGDYDSWNQCLKDCQGYDDPVIINKVIDAIQKVIDGSAAWERDSYLFYEQKYAHQICAMILRCALQNGNSGVRVLDIGGSLGSTYFQNRNYLAEVKNLEYVIAEQEHYANYGRANLENDVLKFIGSRENYEDFGEFDIVLLSGSLQYIFEYEEIIAKVEKVKPHYIIIDRILVGNKKRICKQTVPETIYKSSYPVWIFTEEEIESFFSVDYTIVERDMASVSEQAFFTDGMADSRFYVFEKRSF